MQLDDPLIQVPRFHSDWVEKDNNHAFLIGWSEEETLVVSCVGAMAMMACAYQLEYQVVLLNIHSASDQPPVQAVPILPMPILRTFSLFQLE